MLLSHLEMSATLKARLQPQFFHEAFASGLLCGDGFAPTQHLDHLCFVLVSSPEQRFPGDRGSSKSHLMSTVKNFPNKSYISPVSVSKRDCPFSPIRLYSPAYLSQED